MAGKRIINLLNLLIRKFNKRECRQQIISGTQIRDSHRLRIATSKQLTGFNRTLAVLFTRHGCRRGRDSLRRAAAMCCYS